MESVRRKLNLVSGCKEDVSVLPVRRQILGLRMSKIIDKAEIELSNHEIEEEQCRSESFSDREPKESEGEEVACRSEQPGRQGPDGRS